ncbi:hypothetical protein [Aurantiacibacter poecillastricola]|uniref:hypothetical protein n=1 Tax=Aurantiacibacter poecillastricola TaxID=3064385 RepID=UPI00273E95DE|nr:hypothetical protein [Aurantiacibacter sp. 219JJ12-13]MDP5260441.1 hypothetical protein [Aurantiacibacter sp. 219JJ12-13]
MLAQDRAPRTFTPSGPWTADFGDDYCRLIGDFSDGDEVVTLAFERIQPGPAMRLLVVGDAFRSFGGAEQIGYAFEPRDESQDGLTTPFSSSRTPEGDRLTILSFVSFSPIPPLTRMAALRRSGGTEAAYATTREAGEPPQSGGYDPEAEQALAGGLRELVFDQGMMRPVIFEVGAMSDAAAVLQTCTQSLIESWGVDPQKHASLQRGVVPTGGPIIPRAAPLFRQFSRLTGGYNQFRVMVSKDGAPTSCHVHFPLLEEQKNAEICEQVMANARFLPALDSAGEPIDSYWLVPAFALIDPGPER